MDKDKCGVRIKERWYPFACPECGEVLQHYGGCDICPKCGWSECG